MTTDLAILLVWYGIPITLGVLWLIGWVITEELGRRDTNRQIRKALDGS